MKSDPLSEARILQLTEVLRKQDWVGVSKDELVQVAQYWIAKHDKLESDKRVELAKRLVS